MKKATSVLFLLFLSLLALTQKNQPEELHFNRLFVKDGLPEGLARVILQDKEGYMWIGTQKGLVRYDGYSPRVYNLGIEDPFKRDIGTIFLDRKDRLWVGGGNSNGVLYLYDRAADRFIPYISNASAAESSSRVIYNIHDDQNGHLWLLYYNIVKKKSQLERFEFTTNKFIKYDNEEKEAHNINATGFSNFLEDKKGGIWVGSNNGIYQYNEKTDHFDPHLAITDSAKQNFFYLSSNMPQPGILWMSVNESKPPYKAQGLWRYDTRTNTVTTFLHQANDSSSIASDTTRWIVTDSLGRLWVATVKGLSLFVPAKNNFINYYLKDNSKGTFIAIREIQVDKNNNFWLSTNQGLAFFNTQTGAFTRYPANEKDPYGLANDDVHNLLIDHSGTLWFGTAQIGLQWINKPLSRFIQYKDNPGQPHHFPGGVVNVFAESKDSTIWLVPAHGLYHWQPRTDSFTIAKFSEGLDNNLYTKSLIVDRAGRVWYGGGSGVRQGLYRYDPKTGQTRYFNNNKKDTASLSNNNVSALLEDRLGNIWVGTGGGGICRFNEQSQNFTRYPYIENTYGITPNNGDLDDDEVISIYEDKSGTIWVGTNNGGLNRFNRQNGRFTSYNNQLPGFGCVISIYEDTRNRLWVGTYNGGVFSFDSKTSLAKKNIRKRMVFYMMVP